MTQKIAILAPSHNLSGYISGTKACIDNRKKNFLDSNTSSICFDNMVNFGLLMADICWRVWGTPANFNGFRVLAALLHGTLHRESKKCATLAMAITLSIVDRFPKILSQLQRAVNFQQN